MDLGFPFRKDDPLGLEAGVECGWLFYRVEVGGGEEIRYFDKGNIYIVKEEVLLVVDDEDDTRERKELRDEQKETLVNTCG